MTTPAHENGNSEAGPNAAPTWSWDDSADVHALARGLQQALDKAPADSPSAAHLSRAMRGLDKLVIPTSGHVL